MPKIFITDKEYKADLKVAKVREHKANLRYWVTDKEHKSKNSDCKWYIVEKEYQADTKICFVNEYKASLKVCEVDKEHKAKGSF